MASSTMISIVVDAQASKLVNLLFTKYDMFPINRQADVGSSMPSAVRKNIAWRGIGSLQEIDFHVPSFVL